LESAEAVFERYRALRAREREYVDWPDPIANQPAKRHAVSCQ
jgi:hypothetical protein